MGMSRRLSRPRHVAAALLVIAGLTLSASGTAFANAAGPASCVGHEASNVSPPGSSEEFPGGMPELIGFIRGAAPGPPGASVSQAAKLHEGSHEQCDEAGE